jgi:UDP-GlcNAc:undecaprenyl-phosphate GlcNAc-1-phosphate transferase
MVGAVLSTSNIWGLVITTGIVALMLSAALVPIVRSVALRLQVLDDPEQGKMHSGATPYFGGIAIACAALVVPALFATWSRDAALVGVGALMVGAVGLIDDVRDLHPVPRLGVEVLAALLAVSAGAVTEIFGGWIDVVISVGWIVVITNSFNLLDNMDGVAASIATSTAVTIVVAAALQDQTLVAMLAAGIAGACLGFLIYNWHPAKIFMGDAGSLTLGYLLSVAAMKLRWNTVYESSVVAVILIMYPAIFDTVLVVISRTRAGRSIMLGGTDHTSHRLQRRGVPVQAVAAVLALVSLGCSTLGVLVGRGVFDPNVAIVPVILISIVALGIFLRMPVYTLGAGRVAKTEAGADSV